ncbi:MAG: hypothetical protein JW967_01145 [Dehalococcoidales bacterium]|nr:hypothetical protein [Dehalococcoidales bacterium]
MSESINVDNKLPLCPICGEQLLVRLARGRKSGKPFIMLLCAKDGRHYRAFITYAPYVKTIIEKMEALKHESR